MRGASPEAFRTRRLILIFTTNYESARARAVESGGFDRGIDVRMQEGTGSVRSTRVAYQPGGRCAAGTDRAWCTGSERTDAFTDGDRHFQHRGDSRGSDAGIAQDNDRPALVRQL